MADTVTREAVLAALSKVQEPELHKDLVTLNMIRDLTIDDGKVAFTIVLTTPACPLRGRIENEARQAVHDGSRGHGCAGKDGCQRAIRWAPARSAETARAKRGRGRVWKRRRWQEHGGGEYGRGAGPERREGWPAGCRYLRAERAHHDGRKTLPPQNKSGKLVPAEAYGVELMSIGFLVKPGQPLIWRGPMLHSAIRQFLTRCGLGRAGLPGDRSAAGNRRRPAQPGAVGSAERWGDRDPAAGRFTGRCPPRTGDVPRAECANPGRGGEYELSGTAGWHAGWISLARVADRSWPRLRACHTWGKSRWIHPYVSAATRGLQWSFRTLTPLPPERCALWLNR